jgi:iron complex transport system ATP-binding protein
MDKIIELIDVSYIKERKTVLHSFNWEVSPGEHWAILGLNGSGKTTLLNLLNGYMWPSSGSIRVLGHLFGEVDVRELRKTIGWVSSSLQEKLYGSDRTQYVVISGKHASIGLYENPTEEDFEQALTLMKRLGCGHLVDRTYQSCSQGEKQKLLIARALMAAPRLLILDEACNGLDFISRETLLSGISELAAQPDAPHMLYVTHHTEEILPIFSHTLLIRRGEKFMGGRTQEVVTGPNLSAFFETSVDVRWHQERAWLAVT